MAETLIALGGNLGDVLGAFRVARQRMAQQLGVVRHSSRLYRTAPLISAAESAEIAGLTPAYLNAAIWLTTSLAPDDLLDGLQTLEYAAGRQRSTRWASRELDLDVIAYDGLFAKTPRLHLPHPHLHERSFVLCPLADIAPQWPLSIAGETAAQLLAKLAVPKGSVHLQATTW